MPWRTACDRRCQTDDRDVGGRDGSSPVSGVGSGIAGAPVGGGCS